MIEILGVSAGSTGDAETVVRDREGRSVGTAVERGGEVYVELAADAPAAVQSVLNAGADDGDGDVRLESRFVDETRNGKIRLCI